MFDDFERRWLPNLDELQREMDRYLQHVTHKKAHVAVFSQRTWQPTLDIYETENSVVVTVDLAGVAERDLELIVTPMTLTLRGERKPRGANNPRRYSVLEIPFGPFERTAQLPAAVNPDGTVATYDAGFLEITMQKMTAAEPYHVAVRIG